jgi:dipicolinate synthase subunit A
LSSILSGIKIAVVGGDNREIILISELVKMGATVVVAGFPKEKISYGASVVRNLEEALRGAEVLIMPLPGINENGVVRAIYAEEDLQLTERALASMSKGALVIIGSARPFLKEWIAKYDFNLLEIIDQDDLAIKNSIPTAEGAIQIAMEQTDITIHGSLSCVIGFGRVGITLARTLKALGADVVVVARDPGQLARAYEMGCKVAGFEKLHEIMSHNQIVFSTVPKLILNREILQYANPEILIIDLATQPGSTDFEAANEFGLKAILAPGLPGKVASVSAGKILAEVIPRVIIQEFSKMEKEFFLPKTGGAYCGTE